MFSSLQCSERDSILVFFSTFSSEMKDIQLHKINKTFKEVDWVIQTSCFQLSTGQQCFLTSGRSNQRSDLLCPSASHAIVFFKAAEILQFNNSNCCCFSEGSTQWEDKPPRLWYYESALLTSTHILNCIVPGIIWHDSKEAGVCLS